MFIHTKKKKKKKEEEEEETTTTIIVVANHKVMSYISVSSNIVAQTQSQFM